MFIDSHAHIYEIDAKAAIKNAKDALVEAIVCSGTNIDSCLKSVQLAKENDIVYACVGFHPEDFEVLTKEDEQKLISLAKNEKVVAIGEIGLDYHFRSDNKDFQKYLFVRQLEIAHDLKKPVVVHVRDAMEDVISILHEHKDLLVYGGVIHCFGGDVNDAKRLLDLGLDFTFGGICTFKNSKTMKDVIQFLPLDIILLETDTPYLAPVPLRGQVNEPKNVVLVAEKIAELKNMNIEEIAKITTKNAKRVFKI